jgi:hypothetical protein
MKSTVKKSPSSSRTWSRSTPRISTAVDYIDHIMVAPVTLLRRRSPPRRTGGLQPANAGIMFVDTFVLISRRECFLANFIMRLRNIACTSIINTMKGVFRVYSLSSLFSYIFFNQGLISSACGTYRGFNRKGDRVLGYNIVVVPNRH